MMVAKATEHVGEY